MNRMQAGENIAVDENDVFEAVLNWLPNHCAIDPCAFILADTEKVRSEHDFIHIERSSANNPFIRISATQGQTVITIRLTEIPKDVNKIIFAVSSQQPLSTVFDLNIEINERSVFSPDIGSMHSLILGELYLHHQQWKFRAVGQGFKDGLAFLASRYGVIIGNQASPPPSTKTERPVSSNKTAVPRIHAALILLKGLSKAWVLYSLMIFIVTELLLGGIIGKLIVGRFVPHTLQYALEVILMLGSFFAGGVITGLLSRQVRILEPAIGAFLCVLLTLFISFFSPYSFMAFTWPKLLIGGGTAFLLAFFGAFIGEKISAAMGNRDAKAFFGGQE